MKNIITVILVIACGALAYFVFFGNGNAEYRKHIAELEASNRVLDLKRDSLISDISRLKTEFTALHTKDSLLSIKIEEEDVEIARNKAIAAKSQFELKQVKQSLEKTRHQIDSVKAHPANRTGNDLLNSLKIKSTN
jgi:chromosome segregation ATPase